MNVIPGVVDICDHCSKHVEQLLIDEDGWHLCPKCWPLYHDYTHRVHHRRKKIKPKFDLKAEI